VFRFRLGDRSVGSGHGGKEGLASSTVGDVFLGRFEYIAGQAAINPGGERFTVQARAGHLVRLARPQRLLKQPLDRLVPFT
jgi:hypothetical protein